MNKILFLVLGVIAPPIAVGLLEGIRFHFWINVLLVVFGCFGAIIHAWYLILTRDYELIRK